MEKKVIPGQAWQPSARTHNNLLDLLQANPPTRFAQQVIRGQSLTLAKNSTGSDVSRLGVMAINGVLFDNTDNEEEFLAGEFVLDCDTPTAQTDAGRFVIAAEPIEDGQIGRVFVTGVCVCKIEVDQTWHKYADVKSSSTELKTYPGGGVEILWQESGTGAGKVAVVRFCSSPQVVCEFDLDAAMAVSDDSIAATISVCTIPGYAGQTINVENHETSAADDMFEGDSGDYGSAYYDVSTDKWRMIQMECP